MQTDFIHCRMRFGWCLAAALAVPFEIVAAQWTITMRSMQTPLLPGQCAAIEVVVLGPDGSPPMRPDGRQVSGWDFDLSLSTSAPEAFAWKDERHRLLCALAPVAAPAVVVADYPARHLTPREIVPGVVTRQTLDVTSAGNVQAYGPAPVAGGPSPYSAPSPYPGAAPSSGYSTAPPPTAYPQAPAPSGYSPDYPQAVPPPQPVNAGASPPPPPRNGKEFLRRIVGSAKRKANDVAASTTTYAADAAGDVIGTTLEAGSDVVKSRTGAMTGAARDGLQGVGRSLGAAGSPKDPSDVGAALAAGRAVVYGLRFTEGTAMLEPSSGALISQIASALAHTPGQFLIEAHVDGKPSAEAQTLSEQRAAAVKAALVGAGTSPMQLAAVGYGATRPVAGARSSARVEIARTQ
jgi:outer membrane protein OmpA-like peptidoglycan-associated protein